MRGLISGGIAILLAFTCSLQAYCKEPQKRRAKPPQWSQEVRDVFFEDAREVLVGTRPLSGAHSLRNVDSSSKKRTPENTNFTWSALVDAETLQTEIKRVANSLTPAVRSPGKFKSQGSEQCLQGFSLLSVWFGVIEQFDEQVRWQKNAGALRQQLEQAAILCEAANDESYSAAKETIDLLTDLLRGQSPALDSPATHQQVDRAQLMLRLEQSVDEILGPAISNEKSFRRQSSKVAEESQLLAVIAVAITADGYESVEEREFSDYATELRHASTDLAKAAREKNYQSARSAVGQITQSCTKCHEDFRG